MYSLFRVFVNILIASKICLIEGNRSKIMLFIVFTYNPPYPGASFRGAGGIYGSPSIYDSNFSL